MRVAVVFPGQGTQAVGMGAAWREHPAWAVVEEAADVAGAPLGELLVDAPASRLGRTREAQLAVLTTSLVAWQAVRATAPTPVAFAGHSLGQVTALVAAGTLLLADGVRFAARRADATQDAADQVPGRMAALLGATVEQAEDACAAARRADGGDGGGAWLANDNAPGQVVVAGTPAGVDAAIAAARDAGVRRARILEVGGAFHTPLMDSARPALAAALADVPLADPAAPVVSNHDGLPHTDGAGWRARLVEHVTVPVRFRASLETLARLGATALVEVGHGSMIAGLAKRAVPDLPVVGVGGPEDLDRLEELR